MNVKTSTPILSAVRALHVEQDKQDAASGVDPYNSLARRQGDWKSPAQRQEALWILACYETQLDIQE